jgi:DNA-binding PadR family transcriptional regulator
MSRKGLGEFEQQVLLTILRLGGETYSVPLVIELEDVSGREVSQAAVYIVLRRLEEKGLVSSRMESAAETESSRNRRYFRLEPEGLDRLRKAREVLTRFWDGIEGVLESGGERV